MKTKLTIEGCQLEIDERRGVIYVHGPEGATLLRISNVEMPPRFSQRQIGELPQMLDLRMPDKD